MHFFIVGVDVQMEYTFENLFPTNSINVNRPMTSNVVNKFPTCPKVNKIKKQTVLTDIYREQKKRSNTDIDVSQNKEKRKRACAIIEQFNSLKESFSNSSKELRNEIEILNKTTDYMLDETSHKEVSNDRSDIQYDDLENNILRDISIPYDNTLGDLPSVSKDIMTLNENVQDTEKINNILKEIENEITRKSSQNNNLQEKIYQIEQSTEKKLNQNKKYKRNKPNNYDFIEAIGRSYDDDVKIGNEKDRFADSIKDTLNIFLNNTKQNSNKDCYNYLSTDIPEIISNEKKTTDVHIITTTLSEHDANKNKSLNGPKVINQLIEKQLIDKDLHMELFSSLETVKYASISNSNHEQEHLIHQGVTSLYNHEQIDYIHKLKPILGAIPSNRNKIGNSHINNMNKDLAVYVKNKTDSTNFGATACKQVPCYIVENMKGNTYINNDLPKTNSNMCVQKLGCSTAKYAIEGNLSLPLMKISTEDQQQNMSKAITYGHQSHNTDDNKIVLNVDTSMQDRFTTEDVHEYFKDNNNKSNQFIKINDIQATTSCNLSTLAVNVTPNRKTVSQCQFELVKRILVDFEVTKTLNENETLEDEQSTVCKEIRVVSSDTANLDGNNLAIAPKLDEEITKNNYNSDMKIPRQTNKSRNTNSSLSKIMHSNITNMITYPDNVVKNVTSNKENETLNKVHTCESIQDILHKYSKVLK